MSAAPPNQEYMRVYSPNWTPVERRACAGAPEELATRWVFAMRKGALAKELDNLEGVRALNRELTTWAYFNHKETGRCAHCDAVDAPRVQLSEVL